MKKLFIILITLMLVGCKEQTPLTSTVPVLISQGIVYTECVKENQQPAICRISPDGYMTLTHSKRYRIERPEGSLQLLYADEDITIVYN
jgi:uncharacterized protein YcfL